MGFITEDHHNLSVYEMRKVFKSAAARDYTRQSCFCCCVLSHGQEGVVYGTDGTIDIREMTSFFHGSNLSGKPKLFFFQACQGKLLLLFLFYSILFYFIIIFCCFFFVLKFHLSIQIQSKKIIMSNYLLLHCLDFSGSEYMDSVVPDEILETDGPATGEGNDISLPSEADFLFAYSTVPGYYSWRNSQRGSW